MAIAYTADLPRPADVPAHLDVRVFVTRNDDKKLSAEDLELLARLYPPPDADSRAAVEASIARARARAARVKTSPSKTAKAPPSKRPSAKTSAPNRRAAKKPTRAR